MDSQNINRIEKQLNSIRQLCDDLDFLASPNIEEKMVCSLDCCTGHTTTRRVELIIESCVDNPQSIIGDVELKALRELDEIFLDAIYQAGDYGEEEGFSKKQQWLDFVSFLNTVNALLKDAVKRYKATTEGLK